MIYKTPPKFFCGRGGFTHNKEKNRNGKVLKYSAG